MAAERDRELRAILAVHVAAGLVSAHGVDHGGITAATIAQRALAITDEIIAQTAPEPEPEPAVEIPRIVIPPAQPVQGAAPGGFATPTITYAEDQAA